MFSNDSYSSQMAATVFRCCLTVLKAGYNSESPPFQILLSKTCRCLVQFFMFMLGLIDLALFCLGGRRCNGIITLGRILQFTTGRETEPLLGFSIAPSVCFNDDLVLASANTCICRLSLPHITEMEKDKAFERLDIAFANDFFGFA